MAKSKFKNAVKILGIKFSEITKRPIEGYKVIDTLISGNHIVIVVEKFQLKSVLPPLGGSKNKKSATSNKRKTNR
jgi:hypothetical protein